MSYHIPNWNEKIIVVDGSGNTFEATIVTVIDIGAGIVTIDSSDPLYAYTPMSALRYVDPSGATAYEANSWHYPNDDTSMIGKEIVTPKSNRLPNEPKSSG